jgi:hypothetical protein
MVLVLRMVQPRKKQDSKLMPMTLLMIEADFCEAEIKSASTKKALFHFVKKNTIF